MRLCGFAMAFTAALAAVPAAAQTATAVRKVIAATTLPSVTNEPLHFSVLSLALAPGQKIGVSGTNSVLYQLSGSTDVAGLGEVRALDAGEGALIARGVTAQLTARGGPARVLQFRLAPAADLDLPGSAAGQELFRTKAPIPDLKSGKYDLNLTQVTFPARMPSNAPHFRSGAALYYVVSGTGANTVDGSTKARGPGDLVYEPHGLVHQWGNPGTEPLTFVTLNINEEGVAAVLPAAPAADRK